MTLSFAIDIIKILLPSQKMTSFSPNSYSVQKTYPFVNNSSRKKQRIFIHRLVFLDYIYIYFYIYIRQKENKRKKVINEIYHKSYKTKRKRKFLINLI
jgi:hypothetical protein